MKNILYFRKTILLATIFLMLNSCSNVLETVPITDEYVNPKIPIQNAEDAEKDMRLVNNIFGNEYWQFDYYNRGDASTDNSYAGGDGDEFFQIDEYRVIATNYVIARDWGHINNFVKSCNLIINHVNDVPDLSQARKDEMIGEASLFRALSRFQGVQIWGDFPIVTEYVSTINSQNYEAVYASLYPTRKPIAEVYAAIIADCEVALAKAPTSTSAPDSKFKASKGAANALLAKVYASMPNPDWTKSNQYCDAVIAGGYSLLTTYNYLFDSNHEGNSESIWEANGDVININTWGTNVFIGQNWKKFITPSHTLVKAFNANSDVRRKKSSIITATTSFADPYWSSLGFPYCYKLQKADGSQNFYLFRLADILLLKAEAQAHLGDLSGALTMVNKVRARVSIAALPAFTSKDDAINKILQERFLEMAFEGQRWFDLKREGKTIEILSKQTYTKGGVEVPMSYVGNLTADDLLWPIPQGQLDNNTNLKQNPGY